jgi:hypothetical protein
VLVENPVSVRAHDPKTGGPRGKPGRWSLCIYMTNEPRSAPYTTKTLALVTRAVTLRPAAGGR